jgi:hypothetical protein
MKHKNAKIKTKWIVLTLLTVIAMSGAGLGAYLYVHALQESELLNSLIANCEKNGNPLRKGLQEEKELELKVAEHPEAKLLKALHITRAQAIELSQPQIKRLRYDVNVRYKPIDCINSYK